ncbi:hypothetical protein MTO96_045979 [Rhipicephalus appendiculatus]
MFSRALDDGVLLTTIGGTWTLLLKGSTFNVFRGSRGQRSATSSSSMAQGSWSKTSEGSRDEPALVPMDEEPTAGPVWPQLNIRELLKETRLLVHRF